MELNALMAISPLDGRYQEKIKPLCEIFSEYGLIKFRVIVEVRWLEALADIAHLPDIPRMNAQAKKALNDIIDNFSYQDAMRVKKIESSINHDVKAVEYFLKERIASNNKDLAKLSEFIHFGCTSEDINNLAYALMVQAAREKCVIPALQELMTLLTKFAHDYADLAMLSRTHGQPASPTTVGKEMANVIARLQRQLRYLEDSPVLGKMNGATGNYNAHSAAYPDIDWLKVSEAFVTNLGLEWNRYTTQIEPHDYLAELFAVMVRINNIVLDLDRDTWAYISLNYFTQRSVANEVGSSTMPHKINPIDFENSEGNLGISNALFEHMILKLPISRMQRDLSDSTVLRNIGVAFGHAILAYQATCKGLSKLEPNRDEITRDLSEHWEVLAEAIQTVMRRHNLEQPYEQLKQFTRGKHIDKTTLQQFIGTLSLPDKVKKQLLALTPDTYTGYAEKLAKDI